MNGDAISRLKELAEHMRRVARELLVAAIQYRQIWRITASNSMERRP